MFKFLRNNSTLILIVIASGCSFGCTTPDFPQMKKDFLEPTPSAVNRESKSVDAGAFTTYSSPGLRGISVGGYLTSKDVLSLEVMAGEGGGMWNDEPIYDEVWKSGFSYKRFFGNSFYGRAGIGYRELRVNDSRNLGFGYHLKGHRGEGIISFGNEWQWKVFSFGIEWLQLQIPFASSFSEEGLYHVSAQHRFLHDRNNFSDRTEATFQLYFGISLPERNIDHESDR